MQPSSEPAARLAQKFEVNVWVLRCVKDAACFAVKD